MELFHTVFYWANVLSWVRPIVWLVTRRIVEGRGNVPRRGPLILASNHLNLADPPVLTVVMPRRVVWMAKKELFDIPVFGPLYRLLGVIPVRRSEADLQALRRCRQSLRSGNVLGMFPEGTRTGLPGLRPGQPGTAMLALWTGVPVLPVGVWGTESVKLPRDFFRRTTIHVRFGQPFRFATTRRPSKDEIEQATGRIMTEIAMLLPSAYRGAYAEYAPDTVAVAKDKES